MKTVFVNRFFFPDHSATSQILSDLAFDLAGTGQDVYVIASRQTYGQADARLPPNDEIRGVRVRRVWTSWFGRQRLVLRAADYLTFYIIAVWHLLLLTSRGDIVVAKTDPPLISVACALVAKIRGAILVNWIQDLFPEVAKELGVKGISLVEPGLRKIRNWSLRRAKVNIVLGELMAECIMREGIDPSTIRVIPNWADGHLIHPVDADQNPLRLKWDLQNKFVVAYSGNLGRAHEFETILGAAELLRNDRDIIFLFIGQGAQRNTIEHSASTRGLQNIVLEDYQPKEYLALSLSVADVHLVCLRPCLEGLIVPSKFYGIAAAGRPTLFIGDRNGEIPKVLRDAECGYTVGVGDYEELAKRILELKQDPGLSQSMGQKARRYFERYFDQSHAVSEWRQLLSSLESSRN